MKTIIQTIGPLYGEVVNGSVFGQPNGSEAIPTTSSIVLSVSSDAAYVKYAVDSLGYAYNCKSDGTTAAVGTMTVKTRLQTKGTFYGVLYEDAACTTKYKARGSFVVVSTPTIGGEYNIGGKICGLSGAVVDGTTYYFRVEAHIGDDTTGIIAASNAVPLVGVVIQ